MMSIEQAISIALEAHKGQKDLDGQPVILHPLSVGLKGETLDEKIVGILHDVVEDSNFTFDDLEKMGASGDVLSALRILTHEKAMSYDEYVHRIVSSRNMLAIHVKMNDLNHNISRNDRSTEHKEKVYQKHLKALEYIKKNL